MRRVYQILAELRYSMRTYIRMSTTAAETAGITQQQYLLLLTVAGMPNGTRPTVTNVAERMVLEHNSCVSLIDRTTDTGLVARTQDPADRRYVLVVLTQAGQDLLQSMAQFHYQELQSIVPGMLAACEAILANDWQSAFEEDSHT